MSDLVRNPDDEFSRITAHLFVVFQARLTPKKLMFVSFICCFISYSTAMVISGHCFHVKDLLPKNGMV